MKVKIDWLMDGFADVRNDPALRDQIDDWCEELADRAGRGFDWKAKYVSLPRGGRYGGIVFTDTPRAMVVNARDNTLVKLLGGG